MLKLLNNYSFNKISVLLLIITIPCIAILLFNENNFHFPEYIEIISTIVALLSMHTLHIIFSKRMPSKTLGINLYKTSLSLNYQRNYISSSSTTLSEPAQNSIASYESLQKELLIILKVKKSLLYHAPHNIYEALTDCYRFSLEVKKLLQSKKYKHILKESYLSIVNNYMKELRKIYIQPIQGSSEELPKWMKET